jgi:hypothetical protein
VTRPRFSLCLVLGASVLQCCGGSPTDPRVPPTTGTPDRLAVTAWNFGAKTTSARVEATWGSLYSTKIDVTAEATIRDATQPTARGIEDVTVELLSGHNAGRTAVTDSGGRYYFYPPFVCGPVTARATKAGYNVRVSSSVMCVNGMPELSLTPQR